MKKDVLIMCQYFYPEYVSSAILPTELAEDLVEKGLLVDVICGYPKEYYDGGKITRKETYKKINISRVKYTKFNNKSKLGRLVNFFSFFLAILFKMFRFFKYKTIIVYSNPPILPLIPNFISRISSVKYIYVTYDVYPDNALMTQSIKKGGSIERLMVYINKQVYTNASRIITLGNEMKQYLIDAGIAVKTDIIDVIPNWYDARKLVKADKIKNNELRGFRENWPFIVHYSGNMGTLQDMDTILDCIYEFKDSKDVFFLFAGHGNKFAYVKKSLYDKKINNSIVYGFLQGEDYADSLRIADVCLVSLTKGAEGLGVPSKTYGYLAAGKPVLAIMSNDTDIAKNLYEYNAGKSVLQGNAKQLKNLISNYVENKEMTLIQGANAKKLFADLYDRKICTDKYYDMILEVLNN